MPTLFVIPARDRHTAIIIRRGPSKWTHLIQWDTRDDVFTHGAWVKGRIDGRKCDLSPHGEFFLYYLISHKTADHPDLKHSWTAVSRAPWLYALTLWPEITTYSGGGRFFDRFTVKLGGCGPEPHPDFPLGRLKVKEGPTPLHESSGEIPDSDWCGRDQSDRVIFTRAGQLFRLEGSTEKLVADFTDLTPDPQEAPEWAKKPI